MQNYINYLIIIKNYLLKIILDIFYIRFVINVKKESCYLSLVNKNLINSWIIL